MIKTLNMIINIIIECWVKHDDVIKWKHFPRYWPFVRGIHRSPVNSPNKGQCRGALMFSLICARIKGWVNNGEAGDLRRNRAHYDVTLMDWRLTRTFCGVASIRSASFCIVLGRANSLPFVVRSDVQWHHNERDGVSIHQPHDCLHNRLFKCRSKKTYKLRVTGLYEGNSPVTGDLSAQRASNAETVSIWWRHYGPSRIYIFITY